METEQQVRLNFLEEVEDYFDHLEAVALTLTTDDLDHGQLDRAMRAAHSVKGGAAMMGFGHLSQIAHHLEDFFKILRVREHVLVTAEVESLFLQGIDALRQVSRGCRQGQEIDDERLQTEIAPIFDQLRSHLGELRPEDEDRLLAQEENVDVAAIIFASGVEEILDGFEAQLEQLAAPQLATELGAIAEELAEFGRMGELDAFVQLCTSVLAYLPRVRSDDLSTFAGVALGLWKRSHALVMVGQTSHLPQQMPVEASWLTPAKPHHALPSHAPGLLINSGDHAGEPILLGPGTGDLSDQSYAAIDGDISAIPGLEWLEEDDLQGLQGLFDQANNVDLELVEVLYPEQADLSQAELQFAPAHLPDPEAETEVAQLTDAIAPSPAANPKPSFPELEEAARSATFTLNPAGGTRTPEGTGEALQNRTVRVSTQRLQQLNQLLGNLIVERNAINLQLSGLQDLATLLQDRMEQFEQSNGQLRRWYDRAATEGLLPVSASPSDQATVSGLAHQGALPPTSRLDPGVELPHQFDALEMDRYTDLHILTQEQMEQIVQLQEVATDIALSLRETSTVTTNLDYTTRALQSGLTKIQMRPFSTLVNRFPRMVRDLAQQYGKQVNLVIEGEMTLIDQIAAEALSDALTHLLRNAFDHGIEPAEERLATGKPETGTITLRALHRGNQTLITLQDDGRGLNPEKIRNRLRRAGLAEEDVQLLGDRDLFGLIFDPGFTTAEQVTELSGRGVGLDVVRTNLQSLRGEIKVSTQPGRGTTFTLQVPLAVSVLRVMVVDGARFTFAVPIDSIQGIVRLPEDVLSRRAPSLTWEGQPVDLLYLEDWLQFAQARRVFDLDGTPTINQPTVILIQQENGLKGLCIDRFWGEQEISLSPIQSPVALPAYISGTSIMGNGRVIPLVDPFQLLEWIHSQQPSPETEGSVMPSTTTLEAETLILPREFALEATLPDRGAPELPTLLIVDDSINVRRYLALTLEKAGYQVEQAKDGQEAIDKLLAGLQVKAMICDIEMPRLDGYGVLTELRSRPAYQQMPIAMLTSRMNEKHRKLAMNLGASAYFSKPYNEQELLTTLQEWVQAVPKQSPYEMALR